MALLGLNFAASEPHLQIDTPPWHAGFEPGNLRTEEKQASVFAAELMLTVDDQAISRERTWQSLVCHTEIWDLWRDQAGQFIFTNPMQSLHRQIIVDPDFTNGSLLGDYTSRQLSDNFPLPQDLEIVFFVNWLGKFGDLILHASGIAYNGKGYAFLGSSGVGKSTLAAHLQREPGVTVLGEDQLVLRYLGNQFWIFGTPWHEQPGMCSPMGVPLEKVFFLEKKAENILEPLSPLEGVTRLLQTGFIPYYRPDVVHRILERSEVLARTIPMKRLSYIPGDSVLNRIVS